MVVTAVCSTYVIKKGWAAYPPIQPAFTVMQRTTPSNALISTLLASTEVDLDIPKHHGVSRRRGRSVSGRLTTPRDASNVLHTVNLATLDAQQLSQVKKQLEEELEHLTSSFAQLHAVQGKFKECLRIVKTRPGQSEGKSLQYARGALDAD